MDKILETIMNFINENTTLLIIICVFLIFVLIGYLIDNGIKTKRLEKQMKEDELPVSKPEVIETPIEDKKEEKIIEETKIDEPIEEKTITEKESIEEEKEPIDLVNESDSSSTDTPKVTEYVSNEVTLDPKINDLLLRDFSENGISNIDTKEEQDVSLNPINNIDSIDLPDVSEPIVEEPKEPVIEEPKDPLYKNDKKLSDIFKKKEKKEEKPVLNNNTSRLENTVDFSNELDRILQKLNETNNDIKDSTLDETTDFSNMF